MIKKIILFHRFRHIASADKTLYLVYAICKRCTISVPDFEAHKIWYNKHMKNIFKKFWESEEN